MQNAEGRRIRKTKSRIRPSGYLDFCFILLQLVHCLEECVLSCTTECYVKLFSISSCPLHTGFLCPSPKSMCIGTIIPTPSAHAVKPLWNESTNPSVIVAVNGLIGQNMKMQKWYILAGMGQLQMKMTNKSVEINSQNILISRCIRRSYTKFGTKLASNAYGAP